MGPSSIQTRIFFGCHNFPRLPPIVKIRAPHRDARRTLSTPTRRAPHFFRARGCAQLFCVAKDLDPKAHLWFALLRCRAYGPCFQKLASRFASASWWFMWDGDFVHSCNPASLGDLSQWREGGRLKRFAARKAARVFLARAGAQGLRIATTKAAEGTRAHFVACDSFSLLFFRRI